MPRVMGVGEILQEWTAWRTECVKRRVFYHSQPQEGQAAPAARPEADPARHRQGHRHHPRDGGGGRGHPQPDDRLRHRRDAGRIRRGDQAAQHQQGVYPQARAGDTSPSPTRSMTWRTRWQSPRASAGSSSRSSRPSARSTVSRARPRSSTATRSRSTARRSRSRTTP